MKTIKKISLVMTFLFAGLTVNMNTSQAFWWWHLSFPWEHFLIGGSDYGDGWAIYGGSGGSNGSCPLKEVKCEFSAVKTEAELIKLIQSKGYRAKKVSADEIVQIRRQMNAK